MSLIIPKTSEVWMEKVKKNMVKFVVLFILSTRPAKMLRKWNWTKTLTQIFLSEIIELQKMGAVEVFKLKFLIAPFTLG